MFDKQLKRRAAPFIALALAACASASAPDSQGPPPARGEAMVTAANPHAVNAADADS